jgi:hypothetical protein
VPPVPSKGERWYPSQEQLKDPSSLERSFRQLLTQHYDLQDQHDALLAKVNAKPAATTSQDTSGPATTKLLGLHVEPVDTNSLANGATLKFNKSRGTFSFQ